MSAKRRMAAARRSARATGLALGIGLATAWVQPAPAAHLVTLYRFHGGADGSMPNAAPVEGPRGELYGTTVHGPRPSLCCGKIYRLRPPARPGGVWAETTLYSFKGGTDADGLLGGSSLTLDAAGSLYGTTIQGGDPNCAFNKGLGCGTIYRLKPPATPGSRWTETILHRFRGGGDGALPSSALLPGPKGVFYGATAYGGDTRCAPQNGFATSCGTIYELVPPKTPGGSWTKTVIYRFTDPIEGIPVTDLSSRRGVLYGATLGVRGGGTVFSLTPPARAGGRWSYRPLYVFRCGPSLRDPFTGVVVGSGAVYGAMPQEEGCHNQFGAVFSLTQPARPGEMWTLDILHTFAGQRRQDGAIPVGDLVGGKNGVIFGVTSYGGTGDCRLPSQLAAGCGTVWRLTPPAKPGRAWPEAVLYSFQNGRDGGFPTGISAGARGELYGATQQGGDGKCEPPEGCGTVFKLVP